MAAINITDISTNVQAILEGMGVFVDVEAAPQEGEQIQFSGYPSAFHYFEYNDPSTATVTQNRRSINYTVQAVLVVPDSVTSVEKYAKVNLLTDNLIQTFDESWDLSTDTLPRACDILRPVPAELAKVSTNLGDGLLVTIKLTCEGDRVRRTV